MRGLLLVPGLGLLALVTWEVLIAVTSTGTGPLTRLWSNILWRSFLGLDRVWRTPRVLSWAGGLILVATIVFWVLLLWAGWSLVFLSGPTAVVHTTSGTPADLWDRVYFAGYTLATLGIGDFRPEGGGWQVATAFASLMGLMIVSFGIAYTLPIIGAAAFKRSLGTLISTLGRTPQGLLLAAWGADGRISPALGRHLVELAPLLAKLEEQHVTYPSLHFFTARRHRKSTSINVAVLDEALTILECALDPAVRPDELDLRPPREALCEFLLTLRETWVPRVPVPPPPSLERLRRAGLPVVEDALFLERVARLAPRRQLLAALLAADGLGWEALEEWDEAER